MQTITLNLFTINELSPESRQFAIGATRRDESYVSMVYSHIWEDLQMQAVDMGLDGLHVTGDLDNRHDSGVVFEGEMLFDTVKHLIDLPDGLYFHSVSVGHDRQSNLPSLMHVSGMDLEDEALEAELCAALQAVLVRAANQLYRDGLALAEHRLSDEVIADDLEANGVMFLASGRPYDSRL